MALLELRQLQERLSVIGYPQVLPSDAFFQPNFVTMASLVQFFTNCFDAESSKDVAPIDSEESRVAFIKQAALFFLKNAGIRLNLKRLYAADMSALPELLKIADKLYKARNSLESNASQRREVVDVPATLSVSKNCRQLAATISKDAQELVLLLSREPEYMKHRSQVISQQVNLEWTREAVQDYLASMKIQIEATQSAVEKMSQDKLNLQQKTQKRTKELERLEKRLSSLNSVRPPYMDEYERLEQELAVLYKNYTDKFRHLAFLEHQLDIQDSDESLRTNYMETGIKQLQNQLQQEEYDLLKGRVEHFDEDDYSSQSSAQERMDEYRNSNQFSREIHSNPEDEDIYIREVDDDQDSDF